MWCLSHVLLDKLFNFSVNLFSSLENKDNKTLKILNERIHALRTMSGV